MSWLADAAVWAAFVATCGLIVGHRRRMKRFSRELAEFRTVIAQVDAALIAADGAVRALVEQGGSVAATLADHLERVRAFLDRKAA